MSRAEPKCLFVSSQPSWLWKRKIWIPESTALINNLGLTLIPGAFNSPGSKRVSSGQKCNYTSVELYLASLSWQTRKKLGINSFREEWRRSARLTISYCVNSKCHVGFPAVPSREGYIGNIEYWGPWWKVLQKWRIFCLTKNFLSESHCPKTVKTEKCPRFPLERNLGECGCPWGSEETKQWHFGLGVTILCIPGYLLLLQKIPSLPILWAKLGCINLDGVLGWGFSPNLE